MDKSAVATPLKSRRRRTALVDKVGAAALAVSFTDAVAAALEGLNQAKAAVRQAELQGSPLPSAVLAALNSAGVALPLQSLPTAHGTVQLASPERQTRLRMQRKRTANEPPKRTADEPPKRKCSRPRKQII